MFIIQPHPQVAVRCLQPTIPDTLLRSQGKILADRLATHAKQLEYLVLVVKATTSKLVRS